MFDDVEPAGVNQVWDYVESSLGSEHENESEK